MKSPIHLYFFSRGERDALMESSSPPTIHLLVRKGN